jgi:hypothetical protein
MNTRSIFMKAIFSVLTRPTKLIAGLMTSAALLGCIAATNEALDGAPSTVAAKATPLPAQAQPDARFGADDVTHITPTMGQDARGNRIAVWEESDGVRFNVWAKHSTAGMGWGPSQRLDADHDGNAYSPRIALDAQGNAVAVWEQQVGGHCKVWANRYIAGRGWGAALPIEPASSGNANAPQVALTAQGQAIAVWQQSDGKHSHIRTSRYAPQTGWGTAGRVGSAATYANAPQIAFGAKGTALAVWQQFDGLQTQVWASQQSVGGRWAHATQLGARVGAGDSLNPTIAVDARGQATALWQQADGARNTIWARQYSASTGWGRPTLVDTQFQAQDMDSAPLAHYTQSSDVAAWQNITTASHK